MSPWVRLPSASDARQAAALDDLQGMLEAIACLARLIAAGPVTERERRLSAAIHLAVERAVHATRRLAG
jgi:hypothetical protein